MEITEMKDLINNTGILKNTNLEPDALLLIILGSLIVGLVCLTWRYYFFQNPTGKNKEWVNLPYLEKSIFGIMIGGMTLIVGLIITALLELLIGITFGPINYLSEVSTHVFLFVTLTYFVIVNHHTKTYKGLNFIRKYIVITFWPMAIGLILLLILLPILIWRLSLLAH